MTDYYEKLAEDAVRAGVLQKYTEDWGPMYAIRAVQECAFYTAKQAIEDGRTTLALMEKMALSDYIFIERLEDGSFGVSRELPGDGYDHKWDGINKSLPAAIAEACLKALAARG